MHSIADELDFGDGSTFGSDSWEKLKGGVLDASS